MKTFFQSPKEEWSELEKRAFNAVQEICNKYKGDDVARYGALDAMVWLSSQVEVHIKVLERMTIFFIETTLNGRWIEISEGKVDRWSEMDKYQFTKEMRDKCNSYIHDLME